MTIQFGDVEVTQGLGKSNFTGMVGWEARLKFYMCVGSKEHYLWSIFATRKKKFKFESDQVWVG